MEGRLPEPNSAWEVEDAAFEFLEYWQMEFTIMSLPTSALNAPSERAANSEREIDPDAVRHGRWGGVK